jgi:autotransporter-associated beta strand protein
VIQDGGQNGGTGGSLTKIGPGTLILTGANTYTGDTNIDRGVLQVDSSITSNTFVNRRAILAGTGTISRESYEHGLGNRQTRRRTRSAGGAQPSPVTTRNMPLL